MFLITGATGAVGRPLIAALVSAGAPVRAITRDPATAGLPPAVEIVQGDPSQPDTVATAVHGVTGLFVNPRAVGSAAKNLLAVAGESGVRRVVGLSAINVDDDPSLQPSRFRGDLNKEVEQAVTGSGIDWVSLRPTVMAHNAIGLWGGQIRSGTVVRGPYAKAADAPVDARDVAVVAASALLADGRQADDLLGRRPVLTGPRSLTNDEMVDSIGQAIGRTLTYQEVPPELARKGMIELGLPAGFADANLARLAVCAQGPAVVTGEVERILGRPATTFAEWAVEHAAAFRSR